MSRYAKQVDANQGAIVKALRKAHCHVHDTHELGGGFPDLVVCRTVGNARPVWLLEVKNGTRPCDRKLTPMEQAFAELFPVAVVSTVEEALAAVGLVVKR